MSFLDRFIKYYENEDGVLMPYSDGLGNGAFTDWRHITWIVLTPLLAFFLYRYFRERKELAKKVVLYASIFLLIIRIATHISDVTVGGETLSHLISFHLCGLMGYALPIVIFFDIEKLKMPIYTLSFIGGIGAILFADYFSSWFIPFESLEGIIAHTLLVWIPIVEIAAGRFSFDIKKSWIIFPTMLGILALAYIANEFLYADTDPHPNYLYLRESGFPGNFGGSYYFAIYVFLFMLTYLAIFIPPYVYKKKQQKHLKA